MCQHCTQAPQARHSVLQRFCEAKAQPCQEMRLLGSTLTVDVAPKTAPRWKCCVNPELARAKCFAARLLGNEGELLQNLLW